MEDMASLWTYQESNEELKQKLLYMSFELEAVKTQANEQVKKNKEDMKQLIQFLKTAIQERDDARDQLQNLLNKLMIPSTKPSTEILSAIPQISAENLLVKPAARANSSITESNSFSDQPYNYHTQNSSPVDSLFDTVTSPELSNQQICDSNNNMVLMNHQPYVEDYDVKVDQASLITDNLAKGKKLPERGNFLKTVVEAGPLLQTLLQTGPLPRWRIPPPLQSYHIPPVSLKSSVADVEIIGGVKGSESSCHGLTTPMNLKPYVEMSCGTSQIISNSMSNYGTGASSQCAGNGRFVLSAGNVNNFSSAKRQRFH